MTDIDRCKEIETDRLIDGELNYIDEAATHYDDELLNAIFSENVSNKFYDRTISERHRVQAAYQLALEDIFQSVIQGNGLPAWVEELADKAAKERFDHG